MPEINLMPAATPSRSKAASAQSLLNMYPEANTGGGLTLYGTPGLTAPWSSPNNGPMRGMIVSDGVIYAVSGDKVYRIDGSGTASSIGTIGTASGIVSMASNGLQIMLLDGSSNGHIITLPAGVLSVISDADFPGGDDVAFIDGFFVFREPGTGRFWKTSAYNGSAISGFDFATAEGNPDNLVGLIADHGEVWVAGERTIEVFQNTGASDFPFSRIAGAIIETGCASGKTLKRVDNSVFWLGADERGHGVVWRAAGYTPQRVSTHEIEFQISNYRDISDASAWTYQQDGHLFYVLNFPSADVTWCYDVATDKWHRRGYFVDATGDIIRHRASCYAFLNGKHLVGDCDTGVIYELDADTYTDNGTPLIRELVSQHIPSAAGRVFYREFELRMETGVGLLSGQGSLPEVIISTSNDHGRTWGNERTVSMGAMGEYQGRVRLMNMGSTLTAKAFKVRISDPVKVAIVGCRVEVGE